MHIIESLLLFVSVLVPLIFLHGSLLSLFFLSSTTSSLLNVVSSLLTVGVTFSESWNTSAEIDSELVYEPTAVCGLKLTLGSALVPTSG